MVPSAAKQLGGGKLPGYSDARFDLCVGADARLPSRAKLGISALRMGHPVGLRLISWPAQHFPRSRVRHFSLLDHGHAIHQDIFHALR